MRDGPLRPEKVVIVAGPSFGAALSFMLLGAALGAAGALYVAGCRGVSSPGGDITGAMAGGAEANEAGAERVTARLSTLLRRVKSLSGRVKEVAQQAGETIGPTLSDAVAEAKIAARDTEQELAEDLSRKPDIRPGAVADEQA